MILRIAVVLTLLAPDFSSQLAQIMGALEKGDLASADQAARQLASDFPRRPATHHIIGIVRLRQGRLGDAETAFKKALQLDPTQREARLELSRLYQADGRLQDAQNTVEEGLEILGPDPSLLYQLGVVLAAKRDFKEAIRTLKKVPEEEAPPGYWETVGRILATTGDFSAAEDAYRKLLQRRPGSVPVLRALAGLALKRGDKQAGWDYIAAARGEAPNSPEVLYDFAQVSLANYLLSEAISAARLLLLLEPDNLDALFILGRSLLSGNLGEAAQSVFAEYLKRRPEDPNGHMMMGIALYESGDFQQARARFESAQQLEAGLVEADYYLGMVAYSLSEDAEAEALLLGVLGRNPNHGRARLGLGKLYLRQRKTEQAVAELKTAAQLLEGEPDVQFQLSRAYAQLGQTDLARQAVAAYRALKTKEDQAKEAAAAMPFTLKESRP